MFLSDFTYYTSITLAVANCMIQIFFDMAFGSKSVLRLGGKR